MSSLNITNVVTISVSTPPSGVADFHVNNLALLTKDVPVNSAITTAAPGVYASPTDVGTDFGTDSETYAQAVLVFSQTPNILDGGGRLVIYPMGSSETLTHAINALLPIVPFYGAIWGAYAPNDAEVEAAAAACEPLRIKLFASSYLLSSLTAVTGLFAILSDAGYTHARLLLYTRGATALAARYMAAAYAGRALSVDFGGVNTTATMHLKDLSGVEADPGISQTTLERCKVVGVDVYCNIAGVPKVFSTGGNEFFDNVYNLDWLVFALEVAGFNALAETSTKIPQTEPGMAVLRGAYLNVLQQGVRNGFIAPGAWNSPELFGRPADLIRNVAQTGFYIFSSPVNLQSQSAREAREAPLIQIAVKYAGAIHSTSVVVFINK